VLKVSGLGLGLGLVLVGLDVCMGMENSACHVYLSVPNGK